MDTSNPTPGGLQPTEARLGQVSISLLEALASGSVDSINAPLDELYQLFREKSWKKSPADALLRSWSACASILELDLEPEACARVLHIMRSLAQLCANCGTSNFDDWSQLDVPSAVAKVSSSMGRHAQSTTVQTTGCALISRLSGCSSCQLPNNADLVDSLASAGAVTTLAETIKNLNEHAAEPAAIVCAAEALAALRYIVESNQSNADNIAATGGVALIQSARQLANGHGAADQHALIVLAVLARTPTVSAAECMNAANLATDIAASLSSTSRNNTSSLTRALWHMMRVIPALMGRNNVDKAAVGAFAEKGAAEAVKILQSCEDKNDEITRFWLRYLGALAGCVSVLDASAVPTLVAPSTALLVADKVANASENKLVHSSGLYALWNLLTYGCKASSLVESATLVGAQVSESVKSILRSFIALDPATKPDAAAALVRGLACLGAVECQDFPAIQAQLGLTTALSTLSNTSGSDSACASEWKENEISWDALSAAVRYTVGSLLAAGPNVINAGDSEGRTLVHIMAALGQSKCLAVVLEVAGNSVDLLARTKFGATALQLARQGRHTAAAALLDEVTQCAAEARQAALLEELEASAMSDKDEAAKKASKKKKNVPRSPSFASEQHEDKHRKVGAESTAGPMDAEDECESAAAVARAELRQRLEEEYELALETRRQELAQQMNITTNGNIEDSMEIIRQESSSAERPSTPRAELDEGTGGGGAGSASAGSGAEEDSLTRTESESMIMGIDAMSNSPSQPMLSAFATSGGPAATGIPTNASPFAGFDSPLTSSPERSIIGPGSSPSATTSVHREHSLFGSPSLTGDLFGGVGAGSPTLATNIHSLAAGGLMGQGSGTLPDALFVQHGPADDHQLPPRSPGPSTTAASAMSNLPSASLLASLGGTSTVPTLSSLALNAQRIARHQSIISVTSPTGSHSDGDSDATLEHTRHLWIGNLGTRTSRSVLKAVFETHGIVEDVVTFPGRMYAFVNYTSTEEAVAATEALQNQVVPELTGDRPLLLKYRPVKKAAMHLRAICDATLDGEGSNGLGGSLHGADPDGNSSEPSPRIWLGNIAPTATSKTLQAVLGRFGPLTDAAVFPARIGPLGYAFVKFEELEDAIRALEALNNTVVPPLSGSKQLKMRYKPAASGPVGREESADAAKAATVPSRHLWLGNITQKPSEDVIFQTFAKYGRVDSARVFPAKAYAFVNFADLSAAVRAMTELDGVPIPALTGVKPLVMRFQQENQQPTRMGSIGPGSANPIAGLNLGGLAGLPRVHSESALALAASLSGLNPLSSMPLPYRNDSTTLDEATLAGVVSSAHGGNGWGVGDTAAAAAASVHRSPSLGLLSAPNGGGLQSMQGGASRPTPTSSPFAAMLGMTDNAGVNAMQQHVQSTATASTTQLSAVLNNLAALQRAASSGLPNGAPANQDITALSNMLASQRLQSTEASLGAPGVPPAPTLRPNGGWSGSAGNSGSLDGLVCPLSNQLMTDPVIAADGVTYNRPAIMEWLATQTISPVTQTPIAHAGLVPNAAVKDAVVNYLRMHLQPHA